MSLARWQSSVEKHAGSLIWALMFLWTVLVGGSLMWNLHQVREFVLELAQNEANLSYEKDMAYRLWAAQHGGVYVPATLQSPPNPYLSHMSERDLQTPSGRSLTLVNPAYMTRQVHELTAQLYGSRGHLTSLKPLRPENAPDVWETKALEAFEGGKPEIIEEVSLAGQPHLRLMRPWRAEHVCLKCHAAQGCHVGDIRGGISVAVPLQPYLAGIKTQTRNLALGHGLIWLLGLAGIFGGGRRLQKHLHQRRQAEAELAETLRQKDEALAQLERLASFPKLNPNPVLEIDASGEIIFANQAAEEALQPLGPDISLQDFLPEDWQEIQKSLREGGEKHYDCEIRLKDRVFSESIAFAEPFGVWRIYARDITKRKKAEAALQQAHEELEERVRQRTQELGQKSALLEGINRILRAALSSGTEEELNRTALTVAAEVTGARFGFIDELTSEGRLKPLAISDPGWQACLMSDLDGLAPHQHLEVRGLYRGVIQEGLPMIANNPAAHPDSLGVPAGHPLLTSFLGVPLVRGDQVIGLIGLGNKADGFAEADRQAVETLAASVIEALGRFRAEAKAAVIGRLYRVLSRVNETIVRVHDRAALFAETCRIAVAEGGLRLAWIGLLDQEDSMVKPVAQYGYEQGYLENLMIPVSEVPESRGPTGVAVREGRYDVCHNYATDPRMAPWRERALERGYGSSAAFPLRVGSQVVGAMTLYADRPGFFTADEIGLLESLTLDLSFALESMDREAKRQSAVAEIRRLNVELEERVRARTAELAQVVDNLETAMAGRIQAEGALQQAVADLQTVNRELQSEILERRRTQEKLQIYLRFLEVVHQQTEIKSLLDAFVAEIKKYTKCEAVGIRILQEQGEIPYLAYQGFPQHFCELESPLNIHSDTCRCTKVIKGSTDPGLPFYTPGGSFYLNGTSRFLATVSEEDKGATRNMCNRVGYESVALVPFRWGGQILGLIQVADKRENMVPLEIVEMLERVGLQLGSAYQRLQAEAELRESEARFRSLFENMTEGVVIHELIYGGNGRTVDYRILSANPAFEKHTGLSVAAIQGQTGSQAYGADEPPYLDVYARVAQTGEPAAFETYFPPLQRYFHISVTSPKHDHFVTVFEDITARRQMEEALRRSNQRQDLLAESAGQLLVSVAPQKVVDSICLRVMEFLECDVFFNFLMDEKSGRLHLNAYAGIPETEARRIEWLDYGVAVCGCAARDGCRIVAEDIQTTLDTRTDLVKSYGIQAYACHPLTIQGQVLGTLSFGTRSRLQFTPDELALMKAVADQVAIAIERQQAEEKLRQHTAELSRLVDDLEQKNAEMERFTYMISHDLKSPLVTISTFLGYLEKDMVARDEAQVSKDMGFMRSAADKMSRLLSELLEMSRIGRVVNPPVMVTFRELVQEALDAVAGPLSGRGLEVKLEGPDLILFGDRPRLVEIWQNLVENAVKFMGGQPAPELRIGLDHRGQETVFSVCDNGIGIEPKYHSKIFAIFEKLDVGMEGTGIGLALVKRIVELYQGKIWVESSGAGQGSCFRFTLPGAISGQEALFSETDDSGMG